MKIFAVVLLCLELELFLNTNVLLYIKWEIWIPNPNSNNCVILGIFAVK